MPNLSEQILNRTPNTINFWSSPEIPYSWCPKNVTLDWSGSDNKDNFLNRKIKSSVDSFNISYVYNAQGFRTEHDLLDLYNQKTPVDIALGCSFTEGIGLPISLTWTKLVEKHTGKILVNLGLGGGSTDTVARILNNISGHLNIGTVYILWPPLNRFEDYPDGKNIQSIVPQTTDVEQVWYIQRTHSVQRFFRNRQIVQLLQQLYKFNIKELVMETIYEIIDYDPTDPPDVARDGRHYGPIFHQKVAKWFVNN